MTDYERGKMIKNARICAGISQKEMSEKLNLSTDALYKYEAGKNRIPIDIAKEYCEVLGIKGDDMLGVTECGNADMEPVNEFKKFRIKTLDWIREQNSLSMELLFLAIWNYLYCYRYERDRTPQVFINKIWDKI